MKNRKNGHSILKVVLMVFALLFTSVGCERELTKSTRLKESAEQTQTLNETADADTEELGVVIERNVPVPMRDGTILRADVHRPGRGGPYPVLVQRTPYGKDGDFSRFVKAGYIVVSQDARGRYDSEGKFESNWRSRTHDAEDGYDTVEWAARLRGSTGKVGTFGTSYPAFLQWRLAPLRPPSLVAMSACSIAPHLWDVEGPHTIRPAFRPAWLSMLAVDMRRHENIPGIHTMWEQDRLYREESQKWINWLPWLDLPDDFFAYETDALKSWLRNSPVDPWKLDEGCKEIAVPNLDIVGWYDHCNGDMLLFRTMAKEAKTEVARNGSRIIIGPWGHGNYSRRYGRIDFGPDAVLSFDDRTALQIHWFDYWLKGKQNGIEKEAPVRIFVMGDNKWRDEQHWPLQRTKDKVLYITSDGHANTPGGDGKLFIEKPETSNSDKYVYNPNDPVPTPFGARRSIVADQRSLASRQDILVYQTDELTERVEVTGNPIVELYASSSAPDTDWFVRLIDVHPDGLARDVSSGMVRARYRNGFDNPELITPNEVVKYTIRMNPTSNAFLPGHRIRLDITSSDFPNYDRNHNTAANQNADATLVTAEQTINHGGEYATRIMLSWIQNSAEGERSEPEPKAQMYQIHRAVAEGDVEQIMLLIKKGADVNATDGAGKTPLHYAAESGGTEVARLLIEAGANVHAADENRITPLHTAAESGNNNIVEILIANGADIKTKDRWLCSPLYYAVWEGHRDVAELLIARGADVNVSDNSGFSLLYNAASQGHRDVAELLIAKGVELGTQNKRKRGLTLLHAMAVEGYAEIAELCLSKGARVDERDDNYEFTALHYAARFGNKNVAEVLIANGADINAKDRWGYQPIHWAAYHDRPDIVELLIAKGADINAKTSLDQTPLQLAQQRRNTAAIEVLRKHGARE